MNVIVTILIGIGMGAMVELLLPGHTFHELVLAMSLGMAGALLARFIGIVGGWFDPDQPQAFVAAALGAAIILLSYGAFCRRGKGPSGR